jgi:hypothetical protein
MNREILFRGKRVDNGDWVEGFLVVGAFEPEWYCIFNKDRKFHQVEPESVGQFTGLLDKNGKRIFEGDLFMNGQSLRVIEFHNGNYTCIKPDRSEGILLSFIVNNPKNTVIGNIHDNPELIERAK